MRNTRLLAAALIVLSVTGCASANSGGTPTAASSSQVATTTQATTTISPTSTTTATKITPRTSTPMVTTTPPAPPISNKEAKSAARNVLPADAADDTILTDSGNQSRSCNLDKTYELVLPLNGTVPGRTGTITVKRETAYIQITWDDRGAETIIVAGSLWGYVRAADDSMPKAVFLYGGTGRWGGITNLSKPVTLVACVRK